MFKYGTVSFKNQTSLNRFSNNNNNNNNDAVIPRRMTSNNLMGEKMSRKNVYDFIGSTPLPYTSSSSNSSSPSTLLANSKHFLKSTAQPVKVKSFYGGIEIDEMALTRLTSTTTKSVENKAMMTKTRKGSDHNVKELEEDDLTAANVTAEISFEFIGAGIKLEKSSINKSKNNYNKNRQQLAKTNNYNNNNNINNNNNQRRGSGIVKVNFKEIVNIYEYPSFESFILS